MRKNTFQCPSCGAHLNGRYLTQCPRCNAPMTPAASPAVAVPVFEPPVPAIPPAPVIPPLPLPSVKMTGKDVFGLVCIIAILILIGLIVYRVIVPSEQQVKQKAVSLALMKCQFAIKSTAKFGNAELPPYVKNDGRGGQFSFIWPRGSFYFANGFNAQVPMSASCSGVVSTGQIESLKVNGDNVIGG